MRTELRALEAPVTPGQVTVIEIEVANTADVIDGITARVEGLDPGWVHLPTPVLSLFPDSTGVMPIHVTFPHTTVVGDYLVVVHIESTIDAARHSTHDLWLHVDPIVDASLRLRPSVVTGGKTATFAAIVTNKGNVTTDFTMGAADETRVLDCRAVPLTLTVPPGHQAEAEVWVKGPRPWFGQAVARTVIITAESPAIQLKELATFNQKPRIPRGVLTFAILAAIVALWATIFLAGADLLRADDKPTKAVPDNFMTGVQDVPLEAVAGTLLGKVTAESTGEGVARVTVEARRVTPSGLEQAGSAATSEDGTYTIAALLPGQYKLRFTADGYDEVWYPKAAKRRGARPIPLSPKEEKGGLDVTMSGEEGQLTGIVMLPQSANPSKQIKVSATEVIEQPDEPGAEPRKPDKASQKTTGEVNLTGLTTPATYTIRVQAKGFETQVFEQTLGGGQQQVLNTIRLGAAPGSITGIVRSSTGDPLGNVKVVATSGELVKETTTPTTGNAGTFVLDKLETPRTWVLTFTRDGFSSQTVALGLAAGQDRTGVQATLTGGTGTITGAVSDASGAALGDVIVTVAGGQFQANSATLTTSSPGAPVGSYRVADIPTPGSYAVTFSKEGFVDETREVEFAEPGLQPDVSVELRPNHGTISGTVRTSDGAPLVGVTVELTDGRTAEGTDEVERRSTATASSPAGGYTFTDVPPGAYTLTFTMETYNTRILLVRVAAGDDLVRDATLTKKAA
jgi:hypothetical protein